MKRKDRHTNGRTDAQTDIPEDNLKLLLCIRMSSFHVGIFALIRVLRTFRLGIKCVKLLLERNRFSPPTAT